MPAARPLAATTRIIGKPETALIISVIMTNSIKYRRFGIILAKNTAVLAGTTEIGARRISAKRLGRMAKILR